MAKTPRAPPANFVVMTATIPAGETISSAVNIDHDQLLSVWVDDWTTAHLTFQVSTDGITFYDLFYNIGSREVNILLTANSACILSYDWRNSICWMRARSGIRDEPVPQEADRTISFEVMIA